jgi:hypothetical protein
MFLPEKEERDRRIYTARNLLKKEVRMVVMEEEADMYIFVEIKIFGRFSI